MKGLQQRSTLSVRQCTLHLPLQLKSDPPRSQSDAQLQDLC